MVGTGGFEPPTSCASSAICLCIVLQDNARCSHLSSAYALSSFRPSQAISGRFGPSCFPTFPKNQAGAGRACEENP